MSNAVIIGERDATPAEVRALAEFGRNLHWFSDHVAEWDLFARHRGQFIAVANEELFVADTPAEVERLVEEKHPGAHPFVHYIFKEKRSRIYACYSGCEQLPAAESFPRR